MQLLPYLVTAAELSFLVLGRESEGGAHAGPDYVQAYQLQGVKLCSSSLIWSLLQNYPSLF